MISYQLPSRQMLDAHLAEGSDDRAFRSTLDNEFSRLEADHKAALSAKDAAHEKEMEALRKEIATLKGHVASELVLLQKQRSQDPKFDERTATDYFVGLSAERLLTESAYIKASTKQYAPAIQAPRPGALYADAPGMAIQ